MPSKPAITLLFPRYGSCVAIAITQVFPLIAFEALRQIAAIYAIETRIRGMSAAERLAVRQAESKPLMEAFKIWAEEGLKEVSRRSPRRSATR